MLALFDCYDDWCICACNQYVRKFLLRVKLLQMLPVHYTFFVFSDIKKDSVDMTLSSDLNGSCSIDPRLRCLRKPWSPELFKANLSD